MRLSILLAVATAALFVAPTQSLAAFQLNGLVADDVIGGVRDSEPQDANGNGPLNAGGHTLKVGAVGTINNANNNANGGRVAVYVFQLPNLGANANPFLTSSLTFTVGDIDPNTNSLNINGDLYGLGRRASSNVLATDYYLGNNDMTDADRLQNNILTPTMTDNSTVTTSTSGSSNLTAYLNTQYAGGAGIGQYVFLRLSPDNPMMTTSGYNVFTADDDVVANRPFITYTAVPEPTAFITWALIGLVVRGFFGRRKSL